MCRLRFASAFAVFILMSSTGFAEDGPFFEKLPEDFAVYAVGTHRGTMPVKAELDNTKLEATLANVIVNKPGKPIVLVLTAYAPVVWRVGRTKGTEIAAVLVSGHHGQGLLGIDKETPHAISTEKNKGDFPHFYASGASENLLAMNETVKKLLGREINYFENESDQGVFYIGEKPKDNQTVEYSEDLKIDGKAEPQRLLVGREGLETLVEEKKLRPATDADIEAWVEKASAKFKRFNPKLRVENPMVVGRTYVVLEEITLPDDLKSANARAFIVPENVPFPKGPEGESSFYLMDGTKKENAITAQTPIAQEARYVFKALDQNKDNSLAWEEWNRSKTIRSGFAKAGISIEFPVGLDDFMARYPSYRIIPQLRLPSDR